MMALILSVGFVVDDAIVMLENIFRHMEMGERPLAAALVGSSEIGFTIVSMTLSLTAVFIPVLFMGGILGRLFREFSVTICVAILISGVVSVTLTPMLCSRSLRVKHGHQHSWLYRLTESFFDAILRVYDRTLQVVLRHRPATMFVGALVLAGTVWLFITIPKGFIPDQDTDQLSVFFEGAQGTSFPQMSRYQALVSNVVRQVPGCGGVRLHGGRNRRHHARRPELRAVGGTPEAALETQAVGEPDHRRYASQAGCPGRRARVPPESAHGANRRTGHQESVPALAAVAGQAGLCMRLPSGCKAWWGRFPESRM